MSRQLESVCVVLQGATSPFAETGSVCQDAAALGVALALAKQAGARTRAMGVFAPNEDRSICREALALGFDEALCIRADVPIDYLGAATVLAAAIRKHPSQLIVCGDHFPDNGSAAISVALAHLLALPHIGGVTKVSYAKGQLSLTRRGEAGFDKHECATPAVLAFLQDGQASSTKLAKRKGVAEPLEISAQSLLAGATLLLERSALARHTAHSPASSAVELFSDPSALLRRLQDEALWDPSESCQADVDSTPTGSSTGA